MQKQSDSIYMRRCLDLAVKATGMTYPNPVVGAVVVYNERIIGEGYHLAAGGPHAEAAALNSVREKELLGSSTLYVSLEPCSHHGKTPPCTDLIISSGIRRVVTGAADTSQKVNGRGIEALRKAGINVTEGVLEDECRWVNRRFFTINEKRRPYIILKWAQSNDGFIDIERTPGATPEPYWITGKAERVLVHKWRAEEEAILVGGETARKDMPRLNVRYWGGRDPLKIILSRSGNLRDYLPDNETNSMVFTLNRNSEAASGTEWVVLNEGDNPAEKICEVLYKMEKSSLLVEGGAAVLGLFIKHGLWDEARVFTGSQLFGTGKKAPDITGRTVDEFMFGSVSLRLILK